MDCCFDRTGFPYIELKDPALAVSLLPLTKLQFEYYLADLTPQGDNWYEELLTLNPRVSPQRFTPEQRERLFLTGLLPAEAEAYAAWLGDGYRLPTVAEWRAIYRCFQSTAFTPLVASPAPGIGHDHRFGHNEQQISDLGMQNQPRLETAQIEHNPQVAMELAEMRDSKPVIRYFVSYAQKDRKLKNELLKRLKERLAIAKEYYFDPWDDGEILPGERWHEQIQAAIARCQFGLLLVSPALLGSAYIKDHELPAFVASNLAAPEPEKRAIPIALKRISFDNSIDLKGLEQIQVFRDSAGKAFQERSTDKTREDFAEELFQQILKIVKRYAMSPLRETRLDQVEEQLNDIKGHLAKVDGDAKGVAGRNGDHGPGIRAAALLRRLEEQARPQTLLDLSLMRGGVVEWVRDGSTWTGLGKPRSSFQPNLWNPLRETVPPVRLNQRVFFFGARLVHDIAKIP